MPDDIADADDADEFAVGNRGQMPHAVMRHQAHGALQGIVRGNRNCGMGHDIGNRHGKRSLPMPRDGMYDLAFRYEATDHISTFHDQGGDTMNLHQLRGGSDRLSWFDREDFGSLAIQNVLNAHDQLLRWYDCGRREGVRLKPPTSAT